MILAIIRVMILGILPLRSGPVPSTTCGKGLTCDKSGRVICMWPSNFHQAFVNQSFLCSAALMIQCPSHQCPYQVSPTLCCLVVSMNGQSCQVEVVVCSRGVCLGVQGKPLHGLPCLLRSGNPNLHQFRCCRNILEVVQLLSSID